MVSLATKSLWGFYLADFGPRTTEMTVLSSRICIYKGTKVKIYLKFYEFWRGGTQYNSFLMMFDARANYFLRVFS